MGLFSSSEFDELSILVEKATSEYIPAAQEDLALNLEITDIIKSKRVSPKDALRLLLSRLTNDNPNVQLLSLNLFDKCVKNSGKHFLVEMAGREFVDVAVSMMDDEEYGHECNQIVQDKLIELFQEWALLFQSDPSLAYLFDTYCNLKATKRVIFPIPAKSLDQVDPLSIVSSISPPEWSDSPNCQRCRDQFTMTNRKHHCRKCGGTFCQLCSSNEIVLLEMGINDPVRVCDSCYRQPTATVSINERRQGKVFEKKPFEDIEDVELKKAIELSLKEQQKFQVHSEKNDDEEALKKAIEASLKETCPNHMTVSHKQESPKQKSFDIIMFNPVELENISMFHQLIGRLVRTRPQLSPEDTQDLKKLAGEMRKLQKRHTKDLNVKNQLEESLKGYELLFGIETNNISSDPSNTTTAETRKQIESPPSVLTEDLNKMKNEVFGDNSSNPTKGPEIGLVRTRLGSLSLENQLTDTQSQEQQIIRPGYNSNIPINIQRVHEPMPLPSYQHQAVHRQTPLSQYQQSQYPVPVISPPVPQSSYRHSIPIMSGIIPHSNPHMYNPSRILPVQSTPIQMCPDATIHPHPIHPPFTHVNPYAKPTEQQAEVQMNKKAEKKKKSKKDKKKSSDKEEKKSRKKEKYMKKEEKKNTEKETTTDTVRSKKTKKSKSGEKRIKSIKMEMIDDKEKPKNKRKNESKVIKPKKSEMKAKEDKSSKDELDLVTNTVDEGRRSPINLIDL